MKIIIAPNSFKGSLDAFEICDILSSEISGPDIQVISLPMGDGGDGTASILANYLQASPIKIIARDALGRAHESIYYQHDKYAIIELASICGLKTLQPEEYNVLNANTAGLGMAINHAVKSGMSEILLCIGGSASIDGGSGALKEMGLTMIPYESQYNNYIIDLKDIDATYLQKKYKDIHITILCDVNNPLCGTSGAASVFGPQKGASPAQVTLLDRKLREYGQLIARITGKEIIHLRHSGAAGGIAGSFHALLNARLISGAEYCIHLSDFESLLPQADFVITGEGKLDEQSMYGKIPGVLAEKCHRKHIPVLSVAGYTDIKKSMFTHHFSLMDYAPDMQESIHNPVPYLRALAHDIKKYLISSL